MIFKDSDAYVKFTDALKLSQNTGKAVKVDGITGIETFLKRGKRTYPLLT